MLLELHIKDIALVDELNTEFSPGFCILTGETGAGKSIIVGAITQILGGRADTRIIREGAKSALVEGSFDCSSLPWIKKTLQESGIEMDDSGILIIRREISQNGRNKCYVNGHLTTLSFIKNIGDRLVDIHSQNDHQTLLKKQSHLDFLDSFAGLRDKRDRVSRKYIELRNMKGELEELSSNEQEKERMREMYEFYLKEIDDAGLQPGEEEELRRRKKILANAGKLHEVLTRIYNELRGSEDTILDRISQLSRSLAEAAKIDEGLEGPLKMLDEGLISIEEAAIAARESRDSLDFSSAELETIEERLQLIFSLKRKYGNTAEEILEYRDEVEEKLHKITHNKEEAVRLKKDIDSVNKDLNRLSSELSKQREKHATRLSRSIMGELKELGMKNGRFSVDIKPQEISSTGGDDVEFFISPNMGEKLKPLREIASSGEVSRIMLAIKTVLGENDTTPVLIFDEIDVNIGGKTATIVGEKLSALGNKHQVICITHLPQVARFADTHFRVSKEVSNHRTLTHVDRLGEKEKIEEISRMLGVPEDGKDSAQLAKTIMKKNRGGK